MSTELAFATIRARLVPWGMCAGEPCDELVRLIIDVAARDSNPVASAIFLGRSAGGLSEAGCHDEAAHVLRAALELSRGAGMVTVLGVIGSAVETLQHVDDGEPVSAVCETILELDEWL